MLDNLIEPGKIVYLQHFLMSDCQYVCLGKLRLPRLCMCTFYTHMCEYNRERSSTIFIYKKRKVVQRYYVISYKTHIFKTFLFVMLYITIKIVKCRNNCFQKNNKRYIKARVSLFLEPQYFVVCLIIVSHYTTEIYLRKCFITFPRNFYVKKENFKRYYWQQSLANQAYRFLEA